MHAVDIATPTKQDIVLIRFRMVRAVIIDASLLGRSLISLTWGPVLRGAFSRCDLFVFFDMTWIIVCQMHMHNLVEPNTARGGPISNKWKRPVNKQQGGDGV